ncbi:MAG: DUF1572 family protein [Gemmatimonadaceae bacterium]|nr:DUF1572 family protein [Gemmatimonadaceae bacterium]
MTATDLTPIMLRDLASLRAEVLAYPDDVSPWVLPQGAPNSGGTLVLHLCGNLRHFVGALLGGSGYVRDRDAEFNGRGLTRPELVAQIDTTVDEVGRALRSVEEARLDGTMVIGPVTVSARRGLMHLAVHLTYHLGQLDYHRRLVTGDAHGIGALGLAALTD